MTLKRSRPLEVAPLSSPVHNTKMQNLVTNKRAATKDWPQKVATAAFITIMSLMLLC